MICPDCKGEGFTEGFACPGFIPYRVACRFCKRTGHVTEADMVRKANGRKLRDERLARDESIGEAARRMGISPVELSNIECGYPEPTQRPTKPQD